MIVSLTEKKATLYDTTRLKKKTRGFPPSFPSLSVVGWPLRAVAFPFFFFFFFSAAGGGDRDVRGWGVEQHPKEPATGWRGNGVV